MKANKASKGGFWPAKNRIKKAWPSIKIMSKCMTKYGLINDKVWASMGKHGFALTYRDILANKRARASHFPPPTRPNQKRREKGSASYLSLEEYKRK